MPADSLIAHLNGRQRALFEAASIEHQKFMLELGRLMLVWADVEVVLFRLLRHCAKVEWPVAHAVFSGTRASAAIKFLKTIADNTKMPAAQRSDLFEVLGHVAALNTTRDFVVHHVDGSEHAFDDADPSMRYVTDARRTSRPANARTYLIGSETLRNMSEDCLECCWRLHTHWTEPFRPGTSARGARRPWKFTPPQPEQSSELEI